jgi:7-cyano-7-deazaguanine tRNA-ribosyltransferase
MDYYISWTHSDPVYQQHLDDVRVLVSPPNVSRAWHAADWKALPTALILDSGAFQYHREGRSPDPAAVLDRQLQMAADLSIPTGICHLDVPLLGTRNPAELERRVEQNLMNARWLIEAARRIDLPRHIRLIGVIQGHSGEHIYSVARALADLGYQSFALGSLARMVAHARDELLRRVESALEAVGSDLHILGVSSAQLLSELRRIGVESADSGAPIHEAWRGGVFYSRPFRRYKIESPHFNEWQRSYSFAEVLTAPLPCDCPVCQHDSGQLLEPQGKTFVNLRAMHNYYHLMRELSS